MIFLKGIMVGMSIATVVFLLGVAWVFEPITRRNAQRLQELEKTILLQRLVINLLGEKDDTTV